MAPLGGPPGPSPEGEAQQEPARPSCASDLRGCIKSDSPAEKKRLLDGANRHAREATIEMCQDCLGREAVTIVCILPGPQHPEENRFDLTKEQLDEVVKELGITAGHRFRSLLTKPEVSPNPALDTEIRAVLHRLGFPQIGDIVFRPDADPPGDEFLDRNTVPDPRPAEAREDRYPEAEERPVCASLLVRAYTERRQVIDQWGDDNLHKEPKERQPMNHEVDERTYQAAIDATISATEEDCTKCLKRDLCPILNAVEFEKLFNSTGKSSQVPDGEKFKTTEVVVSILKGTPRAKVLPIKLELTEQKLGRRVVEAHAA